MTVPQRLNGWDQGHRRSIALVTKIAKGTLATMATNAKMPLMGPPSGRYIPINAPTKQLAAAKEKTTNSRAAPNDMITPSDGA